MTTIEKDSMTEQEAFDRCKELAEKSEVGTITEEEKDEFDRLSLSLQWYYINLHMNHLNNLGLGNF